VKEGGSMLDERDKEFAKGLVSPDAPVEHQYGFYFDTQQKILSTLLQDPYFTLQAITLVKPIYFSDKAHQRICRILFKHYTKYKELPTKNIIEEELQRELEDNPALHYFLDELDAVVLAFEPGPNAREYLLDRITEFAKQQALRMAFANSLPLLKSNSENKWAEIEALMREALTVERNLDIGHNYFQGVDLRFEEIKREQERKERFRTGFPSIDEELEGGLSRGEIGSFAGMSGAGKSVALANVAYQNMNDGKQVLYISLEMNECKIGRRLDALVSKVPFAEMVPEEESVRSALQELSDELKSDNRCMIKQFPASSADVSTVRAYLAQLALYGFKPDLLIVDYIGEMRDYVNIPTHESRERLTKELRGLATELDICVFTAMQINRGGREAIEKQGFIDDANLADSAGQKRPLDALWILSQTEQESKAGVGVIFVDKHRNAKSRYRIFYRVDAGTLSMNEISQDTYRMRLSEKREEIVESVEIDALRDDNERFNPNRSKGRK